MACLLNYKYKYKINQNKSVELSIESVFLAIF